MIVLTETWVFRMKLLFVNTNVVLIIIHRIVIFLLRSRGSLGHVLLVLGWLVDRLLVLVVVELCLI